MIDVILDTLIDIVKLLPFLFVTYLVIGWLECNAGEKWWVAITGAGKKGPIVCGVLGAIPQCGFSAISSQFYSAEIISVGTLIAVYLSTSDEMIPIMISYHAPITLMLGVLATKVVVGIVAGLAVDFVHRKFQADLDEPIEFESCGCGGGSILLTAVVYTLQISAFLLIFTFALNTLVYFVGQDVLTHLLIDSKFLAPLASGLIGLIPNCAGSVLITELYLEHVINLGTLLAGLLAAAGVGPLMLFQITEDKKKCLAIVGILYGIAVLVGIACPL
ncbi:MAG: arsenic efflux protein [Eubacterium sp.]|nr:arsenic efflux protein [Candidatus Colimonas fimequi]